MGNHGACLLSLFGKYGPGRLALAPIQVKMEYKGRIYLGDVKGYRYCEYHAPGWEVTVHHFNGEPWPFRPSPSVLTVLER